MATEPGGAYADVVTRNKVKKLCPKEYEAFMSSLRADEEYLESEVGDGTDAKDEDILKHVVSEVLMWKGPFEGKLPQPIIVAWQTLVDKFAEVTRDPYAFGGCTSGLTLLIGYHDSKNSGGGYDGVDGVFFEVEGMYELTPAGRKCQKFVSRKQFVQWG